MNFVYEAVGGICLGGQGDAYLDLDAECRLVLTYLGLRNTLDAARKRYEGKYKVGLFQNDFKPRISMTLANLVAANFSGYTGEQVSFGWSIPATAGKYAITTAHDLSWRHNGGGIGNFIFGYYVVDDAGALVWAERFCPAPMRVWRLGESPRVRPTMYLLNDLTP